MGRINTNVQSMLAQRVLGMNNQSLNRALERLSTGYRINRGSDDPAGLIASENLARTDRGLHEAIKNANRADQVANIAEGGLQEISSLLTELQGLVVTTANRAGLSREEREANQLVIDSILQTIDRIGSSTNFQGIRLLDGSFDFRTSGISTGLSDIRVGNAKFTGASLGVSVAVTASAQQAGLFLSAGGSALDIDTASAFTVELTGSRGGRQLSFASGTTLANMAAAINTFTDVTGLQAVVSGTGVLVRSQEHGSQEFVSVRVLNAAGINSTSSGDAGTPVRGIYNRQAANFNSNSTTIASAFSAASNPVRDSGQDVRASVNGYQATTSGRSVRVNTDFLEMEVTLTASASQTLGAIGGSSPSFTIAGGGASFMLDGAVSIDGQATLGVRSASTSNLGNSSLGYLNTLASGRANSILTGDLSRTQQIISAAITQVSNQRGRLGTFQRNVLGATTRSLAVTQENTAAARSIIRDADFAQETAQLTRSQILVNASTQVLSLANQAPQTALILLG
jgi:flagellin